MIKLNMKPYEVRNADRRAILKLARRLAVKVTVAPAQEHLTREAMHLIALIDRYTGK